MKQLTRAPKDAKIDSKRSKRAKGIGMSRNAHLITVYSVKNVGRTARRLQSELTAQGYDENASIRGVFRDRGYMLAIARDEQWNIVGAISYDVCPILEHVWIHLMRVLDENRGIGRKLIEHLADVAGEQRRGYAYGLIVTNAVESAIGFYAATGAEFRCGWLHVGQWSPEVVALLRTGCRPQRGYVAPREIDQYAGRRG